MNSNIITAIITAAVAAFITFLLTKRKFSSDKAKIDSLIREIESKNLELEQLKQKQTKFWNVISGELKSLFYSFYNSIELLNMEYDQLTDEYRKTLINNIGKSYDQTLGIINELLEWVKANRRRQNTTPEYINLSSLVDDNISSLSSKINGKDIVIEKELGENIPVFCDKMMINFVVKSLIDNAVKFSHRGGIVNITCNKIGNRAELIVADSGIGIPKEVLEKQFILDEINSTFGTENEKGSGLGLLICNDFVEVNNGKISISSEFGKGTKVSVILQATEN